MALRVREVRGATIRRLSGRRCRRSREPPGVAAGRRSRLRVSLQDLIDVPEPDVGIAPGDGQQPPVRRERHPYEPITRPTDVAQPRPSVWMVAIVRPSGANAKVRMAKSPIPRTHRAGARSLDGPNLGGHVKTITASKSSPIRLRLHHGSRKPRSGIASAPPRCRCGSGRNRSCGVSCVASLSSLPEVRPRQSGYRSRTKRLSLVGPRPQPPGARADRWRGTGPLGSATLGTRLLLMRGSPSGIVIPNPESGTKTTRWRGRSSRTLAAAPGGYRDDGPTTWARAAVAGPAGRWPYSFPAGVSLTSPSRVVDLSLRTGRRIDSAASSDGAGPSQSEAKSRYRWSGDKLGPLSFGPPTSSAERRPRPGRC